MTDYNDRVTVLDQLFAAYPNTAVKEDSYVVYLRMLQDIPLQELQMAVDHCICTLKFLPGPAEILEAHRMLRGQLIEQTPAEAWGSVEKALRHVGSWGVPRFRNPLTAKVVELMGWRNLCASDKPAVERAQFMRMYEELAARSEALETMTPKVRAYFEQNVQRRMLESQGGGLSGELRRLGLLHE